MSETIAQAEANAQREREAEANADSHIAPDVQPFPDPATQIEEMVDATGPLAPVTDQSPDPIDEPFTDPDM